MHKLIIRDDDTSFFTSPEQLETIYGRLWRAGHPVTLAVIPAPYGDVRVYWRDGNPFDPSVPPIYRGHDAHYPLTQNRALCGFLTEMARAGLIEVALHGYSHTFYEFTTHDITLIRHKLDEGMAILQQALPDVPIKTFIAPYDRISPIALREVLARGLTVCTQSTNLPPLPELPQITGMAYAPITPQQGLYVCDSYLFTHRDEAQVSLKRAHDLLHSAPLTIIANHYWMFYHDWRDQPDEASISAWYALIEHVLGREDVRIGSFGRANGTRQGLI